jgi:hypothetical protein
MSMNDADSKVWVERDYCMPVFTERLWLKLQRLNKMLLKGVVFNPIKIWTIVT